MIEQAIILAAGYGARLSPLTDDCPKPLLRIGGRALIEYHLERLAQAGVKEVWINVSYRAQNLIDYLQEGGAYGLQIHYSHEGDKPLGGIAGVYRILPALSDRPFWLISADVHINQSFAALSQPSALGGLYAYMVPNPEDHAGGDFGLTDNGCLTDADPRYTFSGIAVVDPFFLRQYQSIAHTHASLLSLAVSHQRAWGALYSGVWFNVGTHAQLAAAEAFLQQSSVLD